MRQKNIGFRHLIYPDKYVLFAFYVQKSLKKEHFSWQLSNIMKDMKKMTDEVEAENRKLQVALKEQEDFELKASAKKKEQAGYLKEMLLCEKKITKKKIEQDKKVLSLSLSSLSLYIYIYTPISLYWHFSIYNCAGVKLWNFVVTLTV